ncbi:mediator of DNA damage checkpoint protein 1 [Rattus norvegicus]|uniref:Mediator of DNA damage checkpoint protein 1 n=2 Tax=Rattus norvegicus TaxID=10116 RepID=MDC1_RAT|nr:mediator of DNA damage checkpoint protein 1 [Rattus norvegicus]Q5U2M8.2 RecName: Full=Mediator of DNA damage checkpoint protein 1 [Rattus norvegicus]|eukprot:NP_001159747.1 mediator of DNA damage checkpoint protein 1 [Rattus norvegicus]
MENTQVIDWDAEEEEETEISSGSLGYSVEPIGRLRFFSGTHGPERDFPLYLGKNVVGRSPDCSVALPFPSISKQHAVIEISAWNKAPILQDCGSLNGTQIVKPPRVLAPGVSHRLRDQELILFADFPCQYHRLNVPPPLVPRSLLTIEKTPRIRGRSQNSRVLLAEDSEEEGDFPSGRSVANGSRNTASPSATVVPESDEEGSSPGPSVPGPSSPFGLGSDTDESQGQQPGVEESSLADNSGAAGEPEQPEVNGVTTGTLAQPTKDKFKDTKMKEEAGSAGVPVGSVVEGSPTLGEDSDTEADEERQPSGSGDSDTDVEEERVPVKKNQVLLGVGIGGPGARGVAHLQDSPTGSDTDVEEDKTALAAPPERSHTAMVINSDTDEEERGEEEEVSAALTLARLKERGIALWSGEPGTEEVKSQPQVLVERSQSASGRDSDTDVEEGSSGGKREIVPDSPMDVDETLTVTQPESQPPCRPNDVDEDVDMSSPGSHLEGKKASSALVDKNRAQVEEEVPGPSVTLGEKHQVPLEGAQPPEEARETAVQEGSSSPVADIRMSQQPVAEDAGTECAAAVSEQKSALEVGAQSRSPAAPVEQVVVRTDTSGDPTLPQREGAQTPTGREREAHVGGTKHAKECCDEPEDLCLSATQCFVEGESQHPGAVQSLEDEPTQVFPCLPQEPGPSHLSLPTPGADTLDVPWEVLATQPFCLREQTETSEPIDTHEAHGSQPSLPGEPPGHQHPVPTSLDHTELLRIDDREMQTVEKAMGHLSCQMMPDGKASGDDPEPSDHRLFSPVPEASASPQSLLTSQSQKQSTPQPMFPTSSSELALPETLHTKPNVRPRRSSRMTPSPHSSAALKPYTTCPTNQPAASRPTSRPTRGRANRSSTRTPELIVPTGPELQPSTSTEQPGIPNLTSQVTEGRAHSTSVNMPEPVLTGPEAQPLTSAEQSVTSNLNPRAQPLTLEPVPQTSHQRRRRATGKQGSRTAPVGPKSYSTPAEPEPQSSASQSSGASEADSPHQKRPRRQVTQKTVVVKEEDPGEIQVKEEPQETAIPTPGKRKRDPAEGETQGNPTRSRRTKPNQEAAAPKVLFTGVVDSRGERAVLALGGSLASSVNEASHLVTDRIRRTVKFLCAVGKGIPILSLNWLYQSRKAGCFLPPDDYLVTDPEQEKNFSFSLRDSLSRARERRLLEDYEIHVTPGVQPPPPQMGEIISCCGGTVLPSMPHSYKLHRVVITCTEDLPRCAIASRLGLPLLSPEFLLTGVLKQEATPEAFVLSNLEM